MDCLHLIRELEPLDQDVIRAKRFELVDDNGKVRARLASQPSGGATLNLIDSEGKLRVVLGVTDDDSSVVSLYDGVSGSPRVALQFSQQSPALMLQDQNGVNRASLFLLEGTVEAEGLVEEFEGGATMLVLRDENGLDRAQLAVTPHSGGVPMVQLLDKEGRVTIALAITEGNPGLLGICTEGSDLQAGLGLGADGKGHLVYQDEQGNLRRIF